jgi:hypothetical protein
MGVTPTPPLFVLCGAPLVKYTGRGKGPENDRTVDGWSNHPRGRWGGRQRAPRQWAPGRRLWRQRAGADRRGGIARGRRAGRQQRRRDHAVPLPRSDLSMGRKVLHFPAGWSTLYGILWILPNEKEDQPARKRPRVAARTGVLARNARTARCCA